MITCIIDKDGYIVNPCIEKKKISEEDICVHVLNDYSLIKPKWNFEKEEWIEGATQEEIQEWEEKNKPILKEPTENEVLLKQLLETQNMLLELQYKLTNKDLTNNLK
ncbi:hypothetical protein FDE77_16290 [Clostridium botulinum]|nr:hypothetical protein [Clostridium botulinum]